jgi:hypothetical protein
MPTRIVVAPQVALVRPFEALDLVAAKHLLAELTDE